MGWDSPPVVSSCRYELDLLTQSLSPETVQRLEARGCGPIPGQHPVRGPAPALVPRGHSTVRDLATAQESIPVLDQSLTGGQTTVRDSVPAPTQYLLRGPAGFSEPAPASDRYQPLASTVVPNIAPYENQPQQNSQFQNPTNRR